MWWMVRKMDEDNERIVYAYSRESRKLDGRFEYLKGDDRIRFEQLAEGDTDADVRFFAPHALRLIHQGAPDEKMIAIG